MPEVGNIPERLHRLVPVRHHLDRLLPLIWAGQALLGHLLHRVPFIYEARSLDSNKHSLVCGYLDGWIYWYKTCSIRMSASSVLLCSMQGTSLPSYILRGMLMSVTFCSRTSQYFTLSLSDSLFQDSFNTTSAGLLQSCFTSTRWITPASLRDAASS